MAFCEDSKCLEKTSSTISCHRGEPNMRECVSYEFSLLLFAGCVTGRVMQKAEESLLMRLKSSVLLNPDYSILGFHDPSLTAVECGEARSLAGNNHVHQCKTGPGEEI